MQLNMNLICYLVSGTCNYNVIVGLTIRVLLVVCMTILLISVPASSSVCLLVRGSSVYFVCIYTDLLMYNFTPDVCLLCSRLSVFLSVL